MNLSPSSLLARALAIPFLAFAALVGPARAGETETPSSIAAPANASSAGEALARSLLVDSGVVNDAIAQAFQIGGPRLRETLMASEELRALPASQRAAVDARFNELPTIFAEEVARLTPALVTRAGGELQGRFNHAHLREIDAFMRTPEGSAVMRRALMAAISAELSGGPGVEDPAFADTLMNGMSDRELLAWIRFGGSEAGQAFVRDSSWIGDRMKTLAAEMLAPALPATLARFQANVCETLGNDCSEDRL